MSAIADDAHVVLLLADYLAIDAAGKLNVLGGGFQFVGVQQTGNTAPFAVGLLMDVPAKHAGNSCALMLELRNKATGLAVTIPGPSGSPDALRIQQLVPIERPQIPGIYLPPDVGSRYQMAINFSAGLPLTRGAFYEWVVEVDGEAHPDWRTAFHVLGDPPQLVLGGPPNSGELPRPT